MQTTDHIARAVEAWQHRQAEIAAQWAAEDATATERARSFHLARLERLLDISEDEADKLLTTEGTRGTVDLGAIVLVSDKEHEPYRPVVTCPACSTVTVAARSVHTLQNLGQHLDDPYPPAWHYTADGLRCEGHGPTEPVDTPPTFTCRHIGNSDDDGASERLAVELDRMARAGYAVEIHPFANGGLMLIGRLTPNRIIDDDAF